jgi:hypothetical protein
MSDNTKRDSALSFPTQSDDNSTAFWSDFNCGE